MMEQTSIQNDTLKALQGVVSVQVTYRGYIVHGYFNVKPMVLFRIFQDGTIKISQAVAGAEIQFQALLSKVRMSSKFSTLIKTKDKQEYTCKLKI